MNVASIGISWGAVSMTNRVPMACVPTLVLRAPRLKCETRKLSPSCATSRKLISSSSNSARLPPRSNSAWVMLAILSSDKDTKTELDVSSPAACVGSSSSNSPMDDFVLVRANSTHVVSNCCSIIAPNHGLSTSPCAAIYTCNVSCVWSSTGRSIISNVVAPGRFPGGSIGSTTGGATTVEA